MGFNTLKQSTEIPTGIKKKMSISRDALENMYHTVDPLNYHLPTDSTKNC